MSADLITRLIEAGTPAHLVAEVAMALGSAAGDQRAIAERRERDAARQRAKRAADAMSRDVHGHNVTSRDIADAASSLDKETSPRPPKEINLISGGDIASARKAAGWSVPEGVDPDHWRDLLANRKSKRLPNTPTAHKRLLADLVKLSDDEWPPGRLVEHAAERGWGAIFDPRERQNGKRSHHNGQSGSGRPSHPGGRHCAAADDIFGGDVGR